MKLSEAIRKGAELRPQAFDWYFDGEGSCALGAAYEGLVGRRDEVNLREFKETSRRELPALALPVRACPARPKCREFGKAQRHGTPTVCGTMAHLNDEHRWAREQIADWVEEVEAQAASA